MADSEAKPATTDQEVQENDTKKLKHLDFVQIAAIYVIVCWSTLYEYAKANSGPLRPGVQTVEGTVKTVIGPVYEKFHDVPLQLLVFVDRKVDESMTELDRHVPNLLKQFSNQAWTAAQKAPEVARELALDVQRDGFLGTASNTAKTMYIKYDPTAKEFYAKYEPVAIQYAVTAWRSLNRLPLFPQVAHIMVPTATYWAEKYNQAMGYAAERGYAVSYYVPLVPIEKIAKTFEGAENGPSVSTDVTTDQYVTAPTDGTTDQGVTAPTDGTTDQGVTAPTDGTTDQSVTSPTDGTTNQSADGTTDQTPTGGTTNQTPTGGTTNQSADGTTDQTPTGGTTNQSADGTTDQNATVQTNGTNDQNVTVPTDGTTDQTVTGPTDGTTDQTVTVSQ